MEAEGWYVDPYGVHDARWFSGGQPTGLVRDVGSESHDDPPSPIFAGSLIPIEGDESARPDDTRRADSADENYDARAGARAAWDEFLRLPKK